MNVDENVVNAINPDNQPNNKTNTFNLVIGIATLLIALLGATFAYFSATARSAENDVTVKSAYVSISYDGGTEIKATNLIPSTFEVVWDKYIKKLEPWYDEIITDYDQYYTTDMADRRCVDAKGKEVCYVYQFSIQSDGVDGGDTPILAYLKINNNEFENLSYTIFEVQLEQDGSGKILNDKYGADIVKENSYTAAFDIRPDGYEGIKFAKFEAPYDIIDEETGENKGKVNPVACLFGFKTDDEIDEEFLDETEKPGIDNPSRCRTHSLTNNKRHTFQLVIWLNETNEEQDEQGKIFEGTVAIEVSGSGDSSGNANDYEDGKITGKN